MKTRTRTKTKQVGRGFTAKTGYKSIKKNLQYPLLELKNIEDNGVRIVSHRTKMTIRTFNHSNKWLTNWTNSINWLREQGFHRMSDLFLKGDFDVWVNVVDLETL